MNMNRLGLALLGLYNNFLKKIGDKKVYLDVPYPDVYTTFPQAKIFEENFPLIREEYLNFLQSNRKQPTMTELGFYGGNELSLLPWNETLPIVANSDFEWRSMFIKIGDRFIKKNVALFPHTTKIIKKIPNISSVFFSYLGPNSNLVPHYGYVKGLLRYHLGLIIPNVENCYLMVDNIKYHWEEGKSVVFDDMFLHSAHNLTNQHRVILYVDFYRPLSQPYDFINKTFISAAFKFLERKGEIPF